MFIRCSKGLFNREQIAQVNFLRSGIEVVMTGGYSFALSGEEAYLFIHALTPSVGVGIPLNYDALCNVSPALALEDRADQVVAVCREVQK